MYFPPCEKSNIVVLFTSIRQQNSSWYCCKLADQPLNIATPGVRSGPHGSGGSLTCGLATQGPRSPERAPSVTNLASLNTHSPHHAAAADAKICTLLAGKYLQNVFFFSEICTFFVWVKCMNTIVKIFLRDFHWNCTKNTTSCLFLARISLKN